MLAKKLERETLGRKEGKRRGRWVLNTKVMGDPAYWFGAGKPNLFHRACKGAAVASEVKYKSYLSSSLMLNCEIRVKYSMNDGGPSLGSQDSNVAQHVSRLRDGFPRLSKKNIYDMKSGPAYSYGNISFHIGPLLRNRSTESYG